MRDQSLDTDVPYRRGQVEEVSLVLLHPLSFRSRPVSLAPHAHWKPVDLDIQTESPLVAPFHPQFSLPLPGVFPVTL